MKWGRGRKKSTKKTSEGGRRYQKNHGRWDEKNLEAKLPTAPLGVEIDFHREKNVS